MRLKGQHPEVSRSCAGSAAGPAPRPEVCDVPRLPGTLPER